MRMIAVLTLLLMAVSPVLADNRQDLAEATEQFKTVKARISDQVNSLPQAQRSAIWTQYYLALDHLGKMEIHWRMMSQHDVDRSRQFQESYAKFVAAIDELNLLIPQE